MPLLLILSPPLCLKLFFDLSLRSSNSKLCRTRNSKFVKLQNHLKVFDIREFNITHGQLPHYACVKMDDYDSIV